jgi:hypothetical protein
MRMRIDPAAIAHAEMTGKVTPEFLARFAEAMGGELMLSVRVPGQQRLSVRLRAALEQELTPIEYSFARRLLAPGQRPRMTFRLAIRPPKRTAGQAVTPEASVSAPAKSVPSGAAAH